MSELSGFILDPQQLLNVGGNLAFVAVMIRFLIKPYLLRKHGLDVETEQPPLQVVVATYKLQMNVAAAGLGVFFAAMAEVLINGVSGPGLLTAVLVGIAGGFGAIGLHQTASNIAGFDAKRPK
jgi:hypothetical protein